MVEAEARRIRAEQHDPEERRARHLGLKRLFSRLQDDGMIHVGVTLPPEIGVALVNQVDADAEGLLRQARAEGGPVAGRDHYRAQALLNLIYGPGWAPRIEVVVVCDDTDTDTDDSDSEPTWTREPVRRRPPRDAAPPEPCAHRAPADEAVAAGAGAADDGARWAQGSGGVAARGRGRRTGSRVQVGSLSLSLSVSVSSHTTTTSMRGAQPGP